MVAWAGRLSAVGAAVLLLALGAAAAVASTPATASNERLAKNDTPKLLALVNLPPGASSQPDEPSGAGLTGAGYGLNSPNVVDARESWHVSESFQATVAYIKAHPPRGSKLTAWGGTGGRHGVAPIEDLQYSLSDIGGRVAPRVLTLEIVQLSDGSSEVRADAEEVWIVSRPASEKVPRGVREIDIREVQMQLTHRAGHPFVTLPILSLKLTNRTKIKRIVSWIDARPLNQPVLYPCHGGLERTARVITFVFRGARRAFLARASGVPFVGSPAPCTPIDFRLRGRAQPPLLGGGFGQVQRILGVRFG